MSLFLMLLSSFVLGVFAGYAYLEYLSKRGGWIARDGNTYKITRTNT